MRASQREVLPGLFGEPVEPPKVWKRQRSTARQIYAVQRETDKAKEAAGKETRQGQVLRCLAWHWNETQQSPTARELYEWMKAKGEPVDDINSVRPKLFYLVQKGLVEPRTERACEHSGEIVWTWAVREAGSKEPR